MPESLQQLRELFQSMPLVRGLIAGLWIIGLLWAFARRDALSAKARIVLASLAAMQAIVGLAANVKATLSNFSSPREWDFFCFWLYGRALALGESPYDMTVLRELARPLQPSSEFLEHMYCLYPPPCVMLFWPLGYLDFTSAMALWYAVQWLALAGSTFLLWQLFDNRRTLLGLLVTAALVLTLDSTRSTLFYAQSTLLILLALLAFSARPLALRSGIWLGLAMLVKPIAAIQGLDLVVRRQWQQVLLAAVPPLLATVAFVSLQGVPGLQRYLVNNPVHGEIRDAHYLETMNQSLLSTVLRWQQVPPGKRPVLQPAFVVAAGILTAITLAVLFRLPRDAAALGSGYVLTLALLVYPGSLKHYTVLLLLPWVLLWRQTAATRQAAMAIASIAVTFGLIWAGLEFQANLLMWGALTALLSTLPGRAECKGARSYV